MTFDNAASQRRFHFSRPLKTNLMTIFSPTRNKKKNLLIKEKREREEEEEERANDKQGWVEGWKGEEKGSLDDEGDSQRVFSAFFLIRTVKY